MYSLQNKVIILTGATGSLGGSLALSLANAKAKIILLGRNQDLLNVLVAKLSFLTEVSSYVVNVMNRESLERAKKSIIEAHGQIDVLINAVGGNLPGAVIPDDKTIFDLSETDFDEVVELNLKGTIIPSVVFGEVMAKQGTGSIVNYSSMSVDKEVPILKLVGRKSLSIVSV